MSETAPVLALDGIRRRFVQGQAVLDVLQGIDLVMPRGTIAALVGPSGTGKSTLLHIAGLLERPSAGEVAIEGRACNGLGDSERTRLRSRSDSCPAVRPPAPAVRSQGQARNRKPERPAGPPPGRPQPVPYASA